MRVVDKSLVKINTDKKSKTEIGLIYAACIYISIMQNSTSNVRL